MANIKILIDDEIEYEKDISSDETLINQLRSENAALKSEKGALVIEKERLSNKISALREAVEDANEAMKLIEKALSGSEFPGPGILPEKPKDGFFFDTSDGPLQEAVDAVQEGRTIYLLSGHHTPGINVSGKVDIGIKAAEGHEKGVYINGFVKPSWQWDEIESGIYQSDWPGFKDLWHHNDPASPFNTRLAYPVVAKMEGVNKVLKWTDAKSLNEGDFHLVGDPAKPAKITVRPPSGHSMDSFLFSPFDRILWGDKATRGISMSNLIFKGCSNTSFSAAINLPGSHWSLENIKMLYANMIAIELGQGGDRGNMRSQVKDSIFKSVYALYAGQMGYWGAAHNCEFHGCGHIGSNTKLFDHQWHASIKFENTHHCKFYDWLSKNCEGPGVWLDGVWHKNPETGKSEGGNTFNEFYSPLIENCVRTGFEFELGSSNNYVENARVIGIHNRVTNPASGWNQSTAMIFKGSSSNNKINGIFADNCEHVVTFDNGSHETRGASVNNEVLGIKHENISEDKIQINGDLNGNRYEFAAA